jgi:hypothetical protein
MDGVEGADHVEGLVDHQRECRVRQRLRCRRRASEPAFWGYADE